MSRYDYFLENCYPEEILQESIEPKFTEFIWTMGGDVYRTRVYGNNKDEYYMTEK